MGRRLRDGADRLAHPIARALAWHAGDGANQGGCDVQEGASGNIGDGTCRHR